MQQVHLGQWVNKIRYLSIVFDGVVKNVYGLWIVVILRNSDVCLADPVRGAASGNWKLFGRFLKPHKKMVGGKTLAKMGTYSVRQTN